MAKSAIFHNFTTKKFIGYWNGKPKEFLPGQRASMPEGLARHFAKHLTNEILLTSGKPADENYTSPKFPEQVPRFMEIFSKCFQLENDSEDIDLQVQMLDETKKEPSMNIDVVHPEPVLNEKHDEKDIQMIDQPVDDDEEEFEGLKPAATSPELKA